MPLPAIAADFHIDDIKPGEGAESDCFTAFQRPEARPSSKDQTAPNIFEAVSDYAFIKIDGKVYQLTLSSGGAKHTTMAHYTAPSLDVQEAHQVTRVDKSSEGDTYHLKGNLQVIYQGQVQTLKVKGTSFCYSGPD
ncbi:MAG: hypothetical protein QM647_12285 [Asticcacaulis sp.]|uniref:hypothetical protein n=1 Tax=Asticcacaulis sp. TaxID=1872648 RepID=UPI0039E52EF4